MKLKFIGTDGSLGLKHGKTYNVTLKTFDKYVVAIIKINFMDSVICPYGSMQALAKNWEI